MFLAIGTCSGIKWVGVVPVLRPGCWGIWRKSSVVDPHGPPCWTTGYHNCCVQGVVCQGNTPIGSLLDQQPLLVDPWQPADLPYDKAGHEPWVPTEGRLPIWEAVGMQHLPPGRSHALPRSDIMRRICFMMSCDVTPLLPKVPQHCPRDTISMTLALEGAGGKQGAGINGNSP